ncbi:WXG100 family type VII secretion target [Aeromicrobium phragmitis]|uniref:ESAT-6-like protein n=1 Tax=Aeromicrobium phragmitis TaxID=2478914 RepID=A0A3L8PNH1_9ACTN|nr:WXG100 family type VII secretion target [Aeromicrobium phragmitis]RLV56881.1 WXG100 family type VII secretion target [Aeromicrobium phragmitis]
MANVNVTYEEMRSAATRLKSGQNEIEGTLDQLKSLVQELVSSGYVTDKSSKAFDASYEDFNQGARQVIEGLTGMGEYLNTAAQTLEDTDEQLAAGLR